VNVAVPTKRLEDVATAIDYGVTASAVTRNTGTKFLRITDIQDGSVEWSQVPFCEAPAAKLKSAQLDDGDIVFARTGATTGKSFLIKDPPNGAVFASYLIRVKPSENVDAGYLAHFFRSSSYWRQIEKKTQGAAQGGVNASSLSQLEVPLPPLDEQRRIAAILDKADALRRKRRRAIELLGNLAQSIFLDRFGDPAANPNRYPLRTFGDISERMSDGPFGSNLKSSHYVETGVRVIRLQNIGVGKFVDEDRAYISDDHFLSLSKHTCLPGDVLVGTLGEPNLRACLQPDWLPVALNKADCVQLRPNQDIALPQYVVALINQPSVEKLAYSLMLGQTRTRISMGRLRDLRVPIAPLDDQRRFVACLQRIAKLDEIREVSGQCADTLFFSLQHRAFSGQL